MLRLRGSIVARLLSSPSATYPASSLSRLLSAAAPRVPPNPSFAVEDYLVGTCGLTPAKALKASGNLSYLKSPTKPDAVLAFLSGLGLSSADVAATVAKDPKLLCASVERTLAPKVSGLTEFGLSHTEVASLVLLAPYDFRCGSNVSKLPYYLNLFGSYENLLRVLKFHSRLLRRSLEKVVKPNVAFLRECGQGPCDIAKLCVNAPWLLTINPERLPVMAACVEGLGVPRGSAMFRLALHAVAYLSEEEIAARVEYLKKTFRWSDAEVSIAVSRAPLLLRKSKESQQRTSEFLISEVGLEPAYIAHSPVMINYSLEGRLKPRYYAVKFLKENGLLKRDRSYYTVFTLIEKVFMQRYICPHKEAAPHLSEDYAAACRGERPSNFIFI